MLMDDEVRRDDVDFAQGSEPTDTKNPGTSEKLPLPIEVNASGHPDQLRRQYSMTSIAATALTIDGAWLSVGSTLVLASANGGSPGIIFEFLGASFYYIFIAASIAELASAIPSAGGVYHWASVTAGARFGRAVGFFAGFLNFSGWFFAVVSSGAIFANTTLQMYGVFHPDYVVKPWHVYVVYLISVWSWCGTVIVGNHLLPGLQKLGSFTLIAGGLVTIIVVLSLEPTKVSGADVWTKWTNETGWPSGVAFLAGMLNGAFGVGSPDSVSHMAEEMPNPRKDLPKATFVQMLTAIITAFIFIVCLMYRVTDFGAILDANSVFPLTEIYAQATGSKGGTLALLILFLLPQYPAACGIYVAVGRTLWTLARDNATPFSGTLSHASERWSCPIQATVCIAIMATAVGAIQLGSQTAFSDIIGGTIVLLATSYLLAILPHLLSGRKNTPRGPFYMGRWGFPVNAFSCLSIIMADVFYCFPVARPFNASTMNYSSVILVGCVSLTALWWLLHGWKKYKRIRLPGMEDAGQLVYTGK